MTEKIIPDFFARTKLYFISELHKKDKLLYSYKQAGFIECGSSYSVTRNCKYGACMFAVITSGQAALEYKNETFVIEKNGVAFFDMNEPYRFYNPGKESLCAYFVYINGCNSGDFQINWEKQFGPAANGIKTEQLLFLTENLISEIASESPSDYAVSGLIYSLLMQVYRNCSPADMSKTPIDNSIKFMQLHFNENISLDDIAKQSFLSKFHFCRTFKASTGLTPLNYLNNIRFDECRRLLANTSLSIASIAEKNGYTYKKAMLETFKKKTGMLPSTYRKIYRT